jgi:hypothetical protein
VVTRNLPLEARGAHPSTSLIYRLEFPHGCYYVSAILLLFYFEIITLLGIISRFFGLGESLVIGWLGLKRSRDRVMYLHLSEHLKVLNVLSAWQGTSLWRRGRELRISRIPRCARAQLKT